MRILLVDIGTGTQDIFLYDSRLNIENGFKMVLPSPTMVVHKRIQEATNQAIPILLSGVTMGGGPSAWGAEAHIQAGLALYATADAARSFNDDLEAVRSTGIQIVSDDEAKALPESVKRIEMRDFDFEAICRSFGEFGVSLEKLDAIAVAVFDHGNAPPDVSDRQFRFNYISNRIRINRRLSSFAYKIDDIPEEMTRLKAVAHSAKNINAPLMVMDTAPAAVLGSLFDPIVRSRQRVIIANVGNFHTLAFRLGQQETEGVFEHHTGFLNRERLEKLILSLADGSLTNKQVYDHHGHGALVYAGEPLKFPPDDFGVAVTGPRRTMLNGSRLRPYFVAPFGDMMITGCFGLLAAIADLYPEMSGEILASLNGSAIQKTPWDI